jgi:hypothetical protein
MSGKTENCLDAEESLRFLGLFVSCSFPGFSLREKDIQRSGIQALTLICAKETRVKIMLAVTSSVGIATLLFAGYVLLQALPDVARYARISRM